MTLARLLAALLLCSLPAFGQGQQVSGFNMPDKSTDTMPASSTSTSSPSEPWRIFTNTPMELSSDQDRIRVDQFRLDQGKVDPGARTFTFKVAPAPDGSLDGDATCYTMRSYVVARDSKDSDSTHPVSYSTCQPASRYRVKTTEERSVSPQR
jgi:hypothetical protein